MTPLCCYTIRSAATAITWIAKDYQQQAISDVERLVKKHSNAKIVD
jgi:hypothetical protein